MRNAAGGGFGFERHDQNDIHQAIVTDLVSLMSTYRQACG